MLTLDGRTQSVREWSNELGLKYETIYGRIAKGWCDRDILSTVMRKRMSGKREPGKRYPCTKCGGNGDVYWKSNGVQYAHCVDCCDAKYLISRARVLEERRKRHLADPRHNMLQAARQRASKHGRDFSITVENIVVPKFCPLLGIELRVNTGGRRKSATWGMCPASPTLDRIDASAGYVPGNVWVISWRANCLKRDATIAELSLLARRLSENVFRSRSHAWLSKRPEAWVAQRALEASEALLRPLAAPGRAVPA